MRVRPFAQIGIALALTLVGAAVMAQSATSGQAGRISAPQQVESRFTGFTAFYGAGTSAYYPMGNYGPGDVAEATVFATEPTRATLVCVRANNGSVQRRSILLNEEGTLALNMSTDSFCVVVLAARDQNGGPVRGAIHPVFR